MMRIRPSLRRVRSQLRLDALEDRLVLSVLGSCPSMVNPAAPVSSAQAATDLTASPADASQATGTDSSNATVCPVTGATIGAPDPGVVPVSVALAAQPAQTALVAPTTLGNLPSVSPDVAPSRELSAAFLAGGELVAVDAAAPLPSPAEAESSFTAATTISFSADEPDLSWVDESTPPGRDSPARFAQADESAGPHAVPVSAYRLAPDFQPLDDSSPFLVATLTTVAVPSPKPEASQAVSSFVTSTTAEVQTDAVADDSPAARQEEPPSTSRAAEATLPVVSEDAANSAAVNLEQGDVPAAGVMWHQAAEIAIPVAGFVLALNFRPAGRPAGEPADAKGPQHGLLRQP
jgi:hypothetical protein